MDHLLPGTWFAWLCHMVLCVRVCGDARTPSPLRSTVVLALRAACGLLRRWDFDATCGLATSDLPSCPAALFLVSLAARRPGLAGDVHAGTSRARFSLCARILGRPVTRVCAGLKQILIRRGRAARAAPGPRTALGRRETERAPRPSKGPGRGGAVGWAGARWPHVGVRVRFCCAHWLGSPGGWCSSGAVRFEKSSVCLRNVRNLRKKRSQGGSGIF